MNGFLQQTLMHNVTIRGRNSFTKGTSISCPTFTSSLSHSSRRSYFWLPIHSHVTIPLPPISQFLFSAFHNFFSRDFHVLPGGHGQRIGHFRSMVFGADSSRADKPFDTYGGRSYIEIDI